MNADQFARLDERSLMFDPDTAYRIDIKAQIVHGAQLGPNDRVSSCPKEKEMRNRHIVDQLADVRAQIKELKDREDDLKDKISAAMGKNDSLGGDQFIALQKVTTRKGAIDTAKLEKAGIDPDAYRKAETTVYQILVEPRVMEAA